MNNDCIIITDRLLAKYFLSKDIRFPNLLKHYYLLFKNRNILIDCNCDVNYQLLLNSKSLKNKNISIHDGNLSDQFNGRYCVKFIYKNRLILGFCDITNWLKNANVVERAEGEFILKDFLKLYGVVRIDNVDCINEKELMTELNKL